MNWEIHRYEGYRPKALDLTAFWRPKLKKVLRKHYHSVAGKALPAIVLGLVGWVGRLGSQRLLLPTAIIRLDPDSPREAQALAVLEQGQAAGYSARHILTEALLALESSAQEEMATAESLRQMAGAMQQMNAALARLQSGQVMAVMEVDETEPSGGTLTDAFLVSVKETSKAGMTIAVE